MGMELETKIYAKATHMKQVGTDDNREATSSAEQRNISTEHLEMCPAVDRVTENDIIIVKILQEEFDFEYEITKKAMSVKQPSSEFTFQNFLPKIGALLNLNENSKHKVKPSNIPNCFSFYSSLSKLQQSSSAENILSNDFQLSQSAPALNNDNSNASTNEQIAEYISLEDDKSIDEFITLLNTNSSMVELNKIVRTFAQEFVSLEIDMLDQIQVINEFLDYLSVEIEKLPISANHLPSFKCKTENLVMSKIYYRIFELECDQERSKKLSEAMKKHAWVELEHLDLPIQFSTHEQLLSKAIDELIKIDLLRSPKEKLDALAAASKIAFQIITSDPSRRERGAATDDYLPFLIYLILKAQPSRLYSNAQFIVRFKRNESPEDRYFFTSLLAAISFIQKLSPKSLSISDMDYDKFTEKFDDTLFEIEGVKVKNIFKKPFNSVVKWFDKELSSETESSLQEQERKELALAIKLSLENPNDQ